MKTQPVELTAYGGAINLKVERVLERERQMATTSVDPAVQLVLDNMQIIVGSEAGSLEIVDVSEGRLTVRYNEGRNDECPECVPTHDMVHQMMTASLKVHAPHVAELDLQ